MSYFHKPFAVHDLWNTLQRSAREMAAAKADVCVPCDCRAIAKARVVDGNSFSIIDVYSL